MNWYSKTKQEVLSDLDVSEIGLNSAEVDARVLKYGKNVLPEAKQDSILVIFLKQFASPLVYILLFACGAVFLMGEYTDGFVILFVLLFNAFIGAFQEGRSQNVLQALTKISKTQANVIREGREMSISDSDVVPGDIIILREGSKVPADARVINSNNLTINESVLTGESSAVHKFDTIMEDKKILPGDQSNMVFKGTYVTLGNGKAIVVATGKNTIIGDIANRLTLSAGEIPLARNIRLLSRLIIIGVAILSVFLFILGMVSGISAKEMFLVAVSVAVSVIPEGLPIVVTLILAQGVGRMAKKNVLVKKLHAVEALGQASILAVDKTGTITKNEMMLDTVYTADSFFSVSGSGYEASGKIKKDDVIIDPLDNEDLLFLGKISTYCANAEIIFDEKEKTYKIIGDPTEAALKVFGAKIGFDKVALESKTPEIGEIPFSYEKKYHGVVHKLESDSNILSVVGAPEKVLPVCLKKRISGEFFDLKDEDRDKYLAIVKEMSSRGLRVLVLAYQESKKDFDLSKDPKDLIFVGIVGIKDGLRANVVNSVTRAHNAGIRVVMITGDHILTASSIAREAGIYRDGDNIISGDDLENMAEEDLLKKMDKVSVFARVTPTHKLDIINLFKKKGQIIAMTGDGVNDAPSLMQADLGVAMGITGTEVAKEASDIILLDDNFENIIEAAEEGRNIYKNIKKVILYLFSTNIGEVLVILGALIIGLPLPLIAVQIIWMNLVTDGFLTIAMAAEPKEKGLLLGGAQKTAKYIVDGPMLVRILTMALPMMVGTIILFMNSYEADIVKGWTVSLTVMSVFQWFNAWNCRSDRSSVFVQNPFKNMPLVWSTLGVIGLHMLAIYNPFFQRILRTTSLSWNEWKVILLVSLSIILTEEIRKIIVRTRLKNRELKIVKA